MPTFTRGQWQTYGTGTFAAAQWHVAEAGAGGAAPNDALLTTAGGFTALSPTHNGETFGKARGQTGGTETPFITWDTAVWDSVRKRLIMTLWGGDQGESSNEVDEWDFATGTWNPDGRPLHPMTRLHVTNQTNWPAAYCSYNSAATQGGPAGVRDVNNTYTASIKLSTGNSLRTVPLGRHTYGGMTFMPSVQRVWAWGGFGDWQSGTAPFVMTEWDTVTKQWQMIDGPDGNSFGGGTFHNNNGGATGYAAASTWDSIANRVLFTNSDGLWAYNPSGTVNARTTPLRSDATLVSSQGNSQLVFDPVRNRAFLIGAPSPTSVIQFDFSGGHTTAPVTTTVGVTGTMWPTWSGAGSSGVGFGPGALYDPIADRIIVWTGGKTLYSFHPSTYVSTPIVGSGTPDPGTPTVGIWNRFWYVAGDDVYATLNGATTAVYVFAPVRVQPALAFTDLAAGPATGNTDTSQGQTSGQDGAIVRIFGTNLGAAADTVTVTINGALASIYDRGACVPPRTAATLSNTIQNLQVIVVQVSHLAASGLGAISVNVNGVDSANTLPFTVQAGAICFAAPGGTATTVATATFTNPFGNLQTAMDALAPGGILYVRSGLNLTTGLQIAVPAGLPAKALVAYPSAECQLGDSTHEGLPTTHSGSGQNWTYSGFTIYGTSTAHAVGAGENTLRDNTRFVGNKVLAPLGAGSLGTVGCRGTGIVIAGNEFTTCGDPANFDPQYHTLYVYGTRSTTATAPIETNRTIIWNYFHANKAARAINIYNQTQASSPISAPISGHNVQYNYITDQVWDGILLGQGVVGDNTIANNVLIDVGKLDTSSTDGGAGLHIEVTVPDSYTGTTPANVIHCYNNTFVNCGAAGKATAGTFGLRQIAAFTPDFHNNIAYQANGLQYLSTGLPPVLVFPTGIAAQWSNNLWFGSTAAPSGDVSSQHANPQLVSAVVPYDARLQSTSPCIATGAMLTFAGTDLQGVQRPATAWDIGANQFASVSVVTPPAITSLQPGSCLPGAANFTLTVFALAGQPFLSGAAVQWDGISRSTTFVSPQQVTAPILAADVAVAGPHTVTASNPGSAASNPLTFNVTLGPTTLSMVYNGTARDRVGQGTTALAADGAFDGVFTVTLGGTGGRTITALRLDNSIGGIWDTDGATGFFILGVADSFDGAFRNNAVTMAVNFFVADGGSFVLFASDVGAVEFAIGVTFTLTATFSDGSTTTGSVLIQAPVTTTTVLKRLALAGGF